MNSKESSNKTKLFSRTCKDCKQEFQATNPNVRYCSECKDKRLTRTCCICGCEFKVSYINKPTKTCGSKECIKALNKTKVYIRQCCICGCNFKTNSTQSKYCESCYEKEITRTCCICGDEFKASKPSRKLITCGNPECVSKSISQKFTEERRKELSEKTAERNRTYYKNLPPNKQLEYSKKISERFRAQFARETPEQKAQRKAKEMLTKNSWSDERKAEFSKNVSDGNKKRYASMNEQEKIELLKKRFPHLINVENLNKEFILANFGNEEGIIPIENRNAIKKYFNMKSSLINIAQILSLKLDLEFKKCIHVSIKELQIRNILKEWLPNEKVIYNDRNTIPGAFGKFLEIDILYPDLKIGIEFNGTYWHQEKEYSEGMSVEDFKSSKSVEKGFKLFHIWENDVENGLDMIFTHLNELGILEHLLERFKNTSNQSKNTSKIVEASSIQ